MFVKVKLKEKGIKILKQKHDELNEWIIKSGGKSFGEFNLSLTPDGYYRTQLHSLMLDFGEYMQLGLDTPFETDIILED